MKKGTTVNLGDSAQTTPREASLDPSKDNLNALRNAHLTPAAIRRVQAGKSINPPERPEESTTPAQKSTPTKAKPNPSPKPSVSPPKADKPEPKSKPTRRQKQRALRAVKRKETKKVSSQPQQRYQRTEADVIIDSWFTNTKYNYHGM